MEQDFVEINGEKIVFFVQRKRIKNMNLRVNKDKEIIVSIPNKMKIEFAKDFIKRKISWIKKQQKFYDMSGIQKESTDFKDGEILYLLGKQYRLKVTPCKENDVIINEEYIEIFIKEKYIDNINYIKKYYDKWLKQYALEIIEPLVFEYQEKLKTYKIRLPIIEIKQRRAVWGSCYPSKNKIVFNVNLIKTPIDCVEYVVLHELSHFKYKNHSKDFYDFVAMFMPDWKEKRNILNKEFTKII